MTQRLPLVGLALILMAACDPVTAGPNRPPLPVIATPAVAAMYSAGETINYSGSATDPEDGAVPAARLSWWADFHHDTHTHPFLPLTTGSASGSIAIPTTGETSDTVWYRFYLVATDATGLADTVFRDVQPRKASITIATVPQGLQITLDGQPHAAPYTVPSVVGINRELGVVTPQISGADTYTFNSWSDAGAATHTIGTPTSTTTYTATFTITTPNVPPTVAITVPTGGDSAAVNTAVTVSANATDSDGTVTGVAFFDGATAIGSDATSPYSISWTPTTTGPRDLTARATDNATATTTSAPVSFTVYAPAGPDNQAPVATLTAPADSTLNLTGAVNLTATATDNVGVVGVQFQLDGVDLGAEDTAAPYGATLAATLNYTTGVHVFRARARDAAGNFSPWSAATVTFGNNVNMPVGVTRSTYGTLSGSGTAMAFAPDGRLFVCQQNGAIRVIPAGGGTGTLATPFHTFAVTNQGEQGLLGIAFHPNFASNGWIYVYYTSPTPVNHNRVSRIRASTSNPSVSDTTETILLDDLPQLALGLNHNGGALHFSPIDGKLYVAIGEQGTASNAQLLTNRLGKVLRYNDDLTIPTDNPFYGTALNENRAIWAYGLRNPFTFRFQPGTGRMFINDVGQSTWEEINDGIAGSNYGWATTEGPTSNPAFRSPLYAYKHSNWAVTGSAIVGGAFYNPPTATFPTSWVGNYFFGDLQNASGGWVNRLDPANGYAAYAFARPGGVVLNLDVGPDGALYVLVTGGAGNQVYRYQAQ